MHYCVTVAVPGVLDDKDIERALSNALHPHYEHEWDWYCVGGRWGNYWTLKPDAPNSPLLTEAPAIGGIREKDDGRRHTDCARLEDIERESLATPYSWLDTWGQWHTKWLGPERSGSNDVKDWEYLDELHTEEYMIGIE